MHRQTATTALQDSAPVSKSRHRPGVALARLAVVAAFVVYLQLIVGATMRHYDAGLAIPDLPLSYGHVLPPTDSCELSAANESRAASGDPTLRPVTLEQIWLHAGHRIGAVVVTLFLGWLIIRSLRTPAAAGAVRTPATLLIPLLLPQLTLGILTVLWRKPFDIASLHVAVGAGAGDDGHPGRPCDSAIRFRRAGRHSGFRARFRNGADGVTVMKGSVRPARFDLGDAVSFV